jgi:hypothetical protein
MLTKQRLLVFLVCALIAFGSLPVAAQSSMTSDATSGLFTTDVDNFLNVTAWQEVEFEKFFSVVEARAAKGIAAGAAFRAGSAYLGFGYEGNFWSGTLYSQRTELNNDYINPIWQGKNYVNNNPTLTLNPATDGGLVFTNKISFLLGLKPIGGLRLDVDFQSMGKDNDDEESLDWGTGDKTKAESSHGLGAIEPGLSWGKTFAFGSGGITLKPSLGFVYTINLQKDESNAGTAGSPDITMLQGVDSLFVGSEYGANVNTGAVGLTGTIGAGAGIAVDFNQNLGKRSVWLNYGLSYFTYDKQSETSDGNWTDYDPSHTGHTVTVGLGADRELDPKFSLGWFFETTFTFENAGVTSGKTSTAGTVTNPVHEYTDKRFGIAPEAGIGFVYQALPGKFNINGSLGVYPLTFSYRKFEDVDSAASTTTTDTIQVIEGMYSTTTLGITWFIGEGLTLDAVTGVGTRGSTVDITNLSVLLNFKR